MIQVKLGRFEFSSLKFFQWWSRNRRSSYGLLANYFLSAPIGCPIQLYAPGHVCREKLYLLWCLLNFESIFFLQNRSSLDKTVGAWKWTAPLSIWPPNNQRVKVRTISNKSALLLETVGAIGAGVNVKDFGPKAPCSSLSRSRDSRPFLFDAQEWRPHPGGLCV